MCQEQQSIWRTFILMHKCHHDYKKIADLAIPEYNQGVNSLV